jgi:uncharacterized membrane protein
MVRNGYAQISEDERLTLLEIEFFSVRTTGVRAIKTGNLIMRISGFGRALFGMSVAGLALLCLAYCNFAPIVEPFPAWVPEPKFLACALATILLAASVGLFFARAALVSAIFIGMYGAIWVVTRARPVFSKPLDVGSWYGVAEALGPLLGVWILYALLRRQSGASATTLTSDRALRVARILFGAACVVYGAAHFAYAAYTAPMVPGWLPGHLMFVYLTGAAHAAAGIALLFGILPRLAATLEATMLTLFGLLVWLPSFFMHPTPAWASPLQVQWSETFLNFLLAGSVWILAASLRNARPQ